MLVTGPQHSIVYQRRPKELAKVVDGEKGAEVGAPQEEDMAKGDRVDRKDRPTWIARSLSSRGRKSSIVSVDASSFSVTQPRKEGRAKRAVFSPNLHQKKRVEAPTNFLQEQKSYFAKVDSFELEEESPSPVARQTKKPQPMDADLADSRLFYCCHSLEVVPEELSGELIHETPKDALSTNRDVLSTVLKTPCNCHKDIFEGFPMTESVGSVALSHSSEVLEETSSLLKKSNKRQQLETTHSSGVLNLERFRGEDSLGLDLHMKNSKLDNGELIVPDDSDDKAGNVCEPHIIVLDDSDEDAKLLVAVAALDAESQTCCEHSKGEFGNASVDYEELTNFIEGGIRNLHLLNPCEDKEGFQLVDKDKSQIQEIQSIKVIQEILNLLPVSDAFLRECGQNHPVTLHDAISSFCNTKNIVKVGEGTFGEAFRGNGCVFKIVPMGGDFQVNGENQKTCAEMYNETVLTLILNNLRGDSSKSVMQPNLCRNFIEAKAVQVCYGKYDPDLVHAWDEWDATHTSENEHPQIFPEKQLYALYVLADGGIDLEHFVLYTFDEVRSLLTQVTISLAVAENFCEFEHRDLHWGNILISRMKNCNIHYKFDGKDMHIRNYGVFVHIIDFTLARIRTVKEVIFCNLSADPSLFEGPRGDIQAETYRRMLKSTEGQWEKQVFSTNCYWIHYLCDILLNKKAFCCSPKEKRALRAFRNRVLRYTSAGAAVYDDIFNGMWVSSLCGDKASTPGNLPHDVS